jgi:cytochrome c
MALLWKMTEDAGMLQRSPRIAYLVISLAIMSSCSPDDKEERRRAAGNNPTQAAFARVADASRGRAIFSRCAACHTIGKGAPDNEGPNLFGIMGSPTAHNSVRFGYTNALRSAGGVWTDERMDRWLTSPQRFVPGTSMGFSGLPDPIDRADLAAYLKTQT